MNRYRVAVATQALIAAYGEGVLELDLSPSEEADALASNVLVQVPRTYRALSDNFRIPQGETFDDAFLVEPEAALIAAGHIERVADPDPPQPQPEITAADGGVR